MNYTTSLHASVRTARKNVKKTKEKTMTSDEVFKHKMLALTVWLEQFSADDCVKVLGVVHEVIEYNVELNLKGVSAQ